MRAWTWSEWEKLTDKGEDLRFCSDYSLEHADADANWGCWMDSFGSLEETACVPDGQLARVSTIGVLHELEYAKK